MLMEALLLPSQWVQHPQTQPHLWIYRCKSVCFSCAWSSNAVFLFRAFNLVVPNVERDTLVQWQ